MTKTVSAPGVQPRGGDKHIKHIIAIYGLGSAVVQICGSIRGRGERWSQGNTACKEEISLGYRDNKELETCGRESIAGRGASMGRGNSMVYSENRQAAAWAVGVGGVRQRMVRAKAEV